MPRSLNPFAQERRDPVIEHDDDLDISLPEEKAQIIEDSIALEETAYDQSSLRRDVC